VPIGLLHSPHGCGACERQRMSPHLYPGLLICVELASCEVAPAISARPYLVVICVNIIGPENLNRQLSSMKITSKLGEYSQSDFAKAVVIVLTLPAMPVFLLLSAAGAYTRPLLSST